jgi:hypothetical protein
LFLNAVEDPEIIIIADSTDKAEPILMDHQENDLTLSAHSVLPKRALNPGYENMDNTDVSDDETGNEYQPSNTSESSDEASEVSEAEVKELESYTSGIINDKTPYGSSLQSFLKYVQGPDGGRKVEHLF